VRAKGQTIVTHEHDDGILQTTASGQCRLNIAKHVIDTERRSPLLQPIVILLLHAANGSCSIHFGLSETLASLVFGYVGIGTPENAFRSRGAGIQGVCVDVGVNSRYSG